jgi:hypothetical protein
MKFKDGDIVKYEDKILGYTRTFVWKQDVHGSFNREIELVKSVEDIQKEEKL